MTCGTRPALSMFFKVMFMVSSGHYKDLVTQYTNTNKNNKLRALFIKQTYSHRSQKYTFPVSISQQFRLLFIHKNEFLLQLFCWQCRCGLGECPSKDTVIHNIVNQTPTTTSMVRRRGIHLLEIYSHQCSQKRFCVSYPRYWQIQQNYQFA